MIVPLTNLPIAGLQQSQIAGQVPVRFQSGYWGLPSTIDDAEGLFGLDIYDRMMNDPDIAGIVTGLKASILEEGIWISPAEAPKGITFDPQLAADVSSFCQRCVEGLAWTDQPFGQTLWDILEALTHGHRLAETTLRLEKDGVDKGKYVLESVAVKPRTAYSFVVDSMNRLYGVTAVIPGRSAVATQGPIEDPRSLINFIPKQKLFLLTCQSRHRDIRGRSLLRAAYSPWKKDQIGHAEDVKFIAQFAGGKTTVTLSPNASGGFLPDGSLESDPKRYHLWVASQLSNGGVGVFDQGTEVNFHMPTATGEAFDKFFERNLRAKARAIAMAVRAFVESRFGSRADSGQAADIVDTFVRVVRTSLSEAVRMQILRLLVEVNFPMIDSRLYLPRVLMTKSSTTDYAANATASATLFASGAITPNMRKQIAEEKLGLVWQDEEQVSE